MLALATTTFEDEYKLTTTGDEMPTATTVTLNTKPGRVMTLGGLCAPSKLN